MALEILRILATFGFIIAQILGTVINLIFRKHVMAETVLRRRIPKGPVADRFEFFIAALGYISMYTAALGSLNFIPATEEVGLYTVLITGVILGIVLEVINYNLMKLFFPGKPSFREIRKATPIRTHLWDSFNSIVGAVGIYGTILITLCLLFTDAIPVDRGLERILSVETLTILKASVLPIGLLIAIQTIDHLYMGLGMISFVIIVGVEIVIYSLVIMVLGPSWLAAIVIARVVDTLCYFLY